MQRRTTIWFLLLFQPLFVFAQNQSEAYECKIGSINPLASTSLNACYKLYDTPKTYQAARKYCVTLGGQLAEKINKDDSSLYSANADLEVTNATQFWVGASNLKCNVGWENGGEIEFNELWAPDSRYYGVAIDKMSLGGLWHTVPVGHQLPFVCTFQGKPKDAAPPVHAMRAPAKKRPTTGKPEDDIDDSLNAALLDQKSTTTVAATTSQTSSPKPKGEDDVDDSLNAALLDEKDKSTPKPEAVAVAESSIDAKKEESADEESSADSASIADQKALNSSAAMAASASSASASSDESSDESLTEEQVAMRKEVGLAAAIMKSQEMAAQSESFDEYTEEDLLAAAATIMGGYTLNLNWADRSTRNTSTFDSETDERTFSLALTIAEQIVLAMEQRRARRRQSASSTSDEMSEESSLAMALADALEMNAASKSASKSESKDESEDSDSMSVEQKVEMAKADAAKAEAKEEKKEEQKDETEDDSQADLASAAAILAGDKKKDAPKATTTTTMKPTTTEPEEDIDDSLNAALADQKSTSALTPTTNSQNPDLSTLLTTTLGSFVGAMRPDRKKNPGCPAEWTQFNANETADPLCFRRFDKPMNFEDARLFCLAKGGHLASIHNERQLLLLSALLHNNGPDTISNQTWIGLNRIHQKYYVYEDETPMDFTRWLPGAPNINDCTVFTGNELPNYPHKGTQYKFGDYPCEEAQKSVLCEVTLGKDKESTQPSCQEGWSYYSHDETPEHGKCYKQIDASKKFIEARDVCRTENSYLASVQNEGEARFVSALLQTVKNYTVDEQTWIGYVKYDGKDYGWEDGNKGVQFDPWTEKLPRDKKCTVFTSNEIHESCRSKFRFVSVDCDKKQRAVLCSKPPMKDGVPFVYKATENTAKSV